MYPGNHTTMFYNTLSIQVNNCIQKKCPIFAALHLGRFETMSGDNLKAWDETDSLTQVSGTALAHAWVDSRWRTATMEKYSLPEEAHLVHWEFP